MDEEQISKTAFYRKQEDAVENVCFVSTKVRQKNPNSVTQWKSHKENTWVLWGRVGGANGIWGRAQGVFLRNTFASGSRSPAMTPGRLGGPCGQSVQLRRCWNSEHKPFCMDPVTLDPIPTHPYLPDLPRRLPGKPSAVNSDFSALPSLREDSTSEPAFYDSPSQGSVGLLL